MSCMRKYILCYVMLCMRKYMLCYITLKQHLRFVTLHYVLKMSWFLLTSTRIALLSQKLFGQKLILIITFNFERQILDKFAS